MRKKLPSWILEGLEKAEKEKQKKLAKEEMERRRKELEEEKRKKREQKGLGKFVTPNQTSCNFTLFYFRTPTAMMKMRMRRVRMAMKSDQKRKEPRKSRQCRDIFENFWMMRKESVRKKMMKGRRNRDEKKR
jgi:hypothetical protein